jgi:cilia- and flagella-associated protein 43
MLHNKDFDEILVKKGNEIARIKEKNKRIQKILLDLGIRDPIFQPELGPIEKPEMLLVTADIEVC